MWPGTHVADGSRLVKVRFNDHVQSLPYSIPFTMALCPEYFRVIHDRQMRVCRLCLQPGHILHDCPDFSCHRCGIQGHYARECPQQHPQQQWRNQKCEICYNGHVRTVAMCVCNYSEGDSRSADLHVSAVSSRVSLKWDWEVDSDENPGSDEEPPAPALTPPTQAPPAALTGVFSLGSGACCCSSASLSP